MQGETLSGTEVAVGVVAFVAFLGGLAVYAWPVVAVSSAVLAVIAVNAAGVRS